MNDPPPSARPPARAVALLRAALVVVIFLTEHLLDNHRLYTDAFDSILALAATYVLIGVAFASQDPPVKALRRVEPWIDVAFLAALTYTSGGAFSDLRVAFFVIPLAVSFREDARTTITWSTIALVAFTLAAFARPTGRSPTGTSLIISTDLYLAWAAAAASVLSATLGRRTARKRELAESRQQLIARALESIERERIRLASALHDEPVQSLIAARHDLRRAQRTGDPDSFARLHASIDSTLIQLREEIFNLHPHILDHLGAAAAIEQLAQQHRHNHQAHITTNIDPDATSAHELVIYSLARELLANAATHANASEIHAALTRDVEHVTLTVTDNGHGIPPERLKQAVLDGHIGLAAAAERVSALGGTMQITSAHLQGTTVRVNLPSRRRQERATPPDEHSFEPNGYLGPERRRLVPH